MLYPEIEPRESGYLSVSAPHELYYERLGNPNGIPLVFLHGGPGSGINPLERRFFNPDSYDILMFDQRGSGKSRPAACLEDNTTQFLVSDMEAFRIRFGYERWVVAGGSWGSTLSLAYGSAHPDRVLGLVIWGIFLGRDSEFFNSYRSGGVASQVFPDEHRAFIEFLPAEERDDPIGGFYRRAIQDHDRELRNRSCYQWGLWEEQISALVPDPVQIRQAMADQQFVTDRALIELHYFKERCFLDGDEILAELPFGEIPLFIINGRYDVLCPVVTAREVAARAALGNSRFLIVPNAGHTMHDPNMQAAIVSYTDQMALYLTTDRP